MKVLLLAVNAKYIHSNLAVYSLKAYAGKEGYQTEILECTINQSKDQILKGIYERKPDLLCDILGSVIKVTGIKSSVTQDRLVKGILDDRFLLIIIESGEQEPSGMVINSR